MAELRYVIHNLEVIGRKEVVQKRGQSENVNDILVQEHVDEDDYQPAVKVYGSSSTSTTEIVGAGGAEDSPNRPKTRKIGDPLWQTERPFK